MSLSVSGAEIRDYCRRGNNVLNAIISFAVTGDDFESTPDVVVSSGGGSGATAHAVMKFGHVESIEPDEAGSSYETDPTVTIGGVTSGGGTGATATSNRTGDIVTSYTLTNSGGRSITLTDLSEYDTDGGDSRATVNFYLADKFGHVKEAQMTSSDGDDSITVSFGKDSFGDAMDATEGISINVTVKSALGNIKDGSVHDVATIKQGGFFYIEA